MLTEETALPVTPSSVCVVKDIHVHYGRGCGFNGPADHVAAMNIRNAGLESLSLGAGQCARNATPFSDTSVLEGTIGGLPPEDVGATSGSCKPATLVVGN